LAHPLTNCDDFLTLIVYTLAIISIDPGIIFDAMSVVFPCKWPFGGTQIQTPRKDVHGSQNQSTNLVPFKNHPASRKPHLNGHVHSHMSSAGVEGSQMERNQSSGIAKN